MTEFFWWNSTKSFFNIEGIDLFVKILYLRRGRKVGGKFKYLEVRGKLIALKKFFEAFVELAQSLKTDHH